MTNDGKDSADSPCEEFLEMPCSFFGGIPHRYARIYLPFKYSCRNIAQVPMVQNLPLMRMDSLA